MTPIADMMAFKKAGHDTSASLAKMLWDPGTSLIRRGRGPEMLAGDVAETIELKRDGDEIQNDRGANNLAEGRENDEEYTPGINVPKSKEHVTSPNDWAIIAAEDGKQRMRSAENYISEGPTEMEEPSMEDVLDAQYRLDHPEDNEGVPSERDSMIARRQTRA